MPFGLEWGQVLRLVVLVPRWLETIRAAAPLIRETIDVVDKPSPPARKEEVVKAVEREMTYYEREQKKQEERGGD